MQFSTRLINCKQHTAGSKSETTSENSSVLHFIFYFLYISYNEHRHAFEHV